MDANTVIAELVALDVPSEITDGQAVEIAHMFAGDHALFMDMDSRPGRYASYADIDDWHWKLRQARNRSDISPHFFDILQADSKAGTTA